MQMSSKLRSMVGGVSWWCPGCEEMHWIRTGEGQWFFDGDAEHPTFSPSVLVTNGHFAEGHTGDCWCTYEARTGEAPGFSCKRCHTFVRGGIIEFLSDCSHALAGQTVPMPDLPAENRD